MIFLTIPSASFSRGGAVSEFTEGTGLELSSTLWGNDTPLLQIQRCLHRQLASLWLSLGFASSVGSTATFEAMVLVAQPSAHICSLFFYEARIEDSEREMVTALQFPISDQFLFLFQGLRSLVPLYLFSAVPYKDSTRVIQSYK